jgi:hypothetical protein
VSFNEPIDVSTFTPDKIASFTDPNGADVQVVAVLPAAGSGFMSFDIFFAPQTTTGIYTMVLGPDIHDVYGNAMDQDGNDIPGEPGPAPAGDQFTLHFAVPGPRITSSSSLGSQFAGFDHVRVTFNVPMDPSTFIPGQAVLTGPGGNPIVVTAVTPVPLTNNTQFDVHFLPLGALGSYHLVIGPDIHDLYDNPMDQNGDYVPGEVPGDQYTATFSIAAPQVTSNTLTTRTLLDTATTARFTFSTPMDVASVTPDQFQLTGPGGAVQDVAAVNVVPNTNSMTFEITFALTAGPGTYHITVGTGVRDIFGNHLASAFTGQFTVISSTVGPDASGYVATVTAFTPGSIMSQPGTFTVITSGDNVSNAINLGTNTFTFYGTTYTGNNRLYVSTNGLITFGVADTSYSNGDLTSSPSEPTIAVLWTDWITTTTPGVVAQFAGFDNNGTPHQLIIEWSQLRHIGYTGTISFQAILSINTGAAEGDIVLNYLNLQSGDTYAEGRNSTVGIKANGTQGSHRLVLDPGSGVTPFVGTGQAVRFSVLPVVLSVTPSGLTRLPVDHAVVTFDTPIDPDTFTPGQVGLSGPNGPIDITDVIAVDGSDNVQFLITFDAQADPGGYTLVIGPGIMDFSGNSVPVFTDNFTLTDEVIFNPGFERGDFTGWTTLGSAAIKTSSFGSGPTEGTYDALVTNDSGPNHTVVESFLGLAANALSGLVSNVTNGSAIKQTLTVSAGMTLTFDWNFLTNESVGEHTYRDFGFLSITPVGAGGTLVDLADTTSPLVAAPSATGFNHMTGFNTFTFTFTADGTYTLGVGAMNAGDTGTNSALLVDNFQVTMSEGGGAVAGTLGREAVAHGVSQPSTEANPLAALAAWSRDPSAVSAAATVAVFASSQESTSVPAPLSTRPSDQAWTILGSQSDTGVDLMALPGDADVLWPSGSAGKPLP